MTSMGTSVHGTCCRLRICPAYPMSRGRCASSTRSGIAFSSGPAYTYRHTACSSRQSIASSAKMSPVSTERFVKLCTDLGVDAKAISSVELRASDQFQGNGLYTSRVRVNFALSYHRHSLTIPEIAGRDGVAPRLLLDLLPLTSRGPHPVPSAPASAGRREG